MEHPTVVEKNTKVVRNGRVVRDQYYITGLIIPGVNIEAIEAGLKVELPKYVQSALPPKRRASVVRQLYLIIIPIEVSDYMRTVGAMHVVFTTTEVLPSEGHYRLT